MNLSELTNMNESRGPVWKKVGEWKLSAEKNTYESIFTRLEMILAPFNLSSDFIRGIVLTINKVVTRIPQDNHTRVKSVQLSFYVPSGQIPKGKTWGFFNTERVRYGDDSTGMIEHTINFYLFVEGQ